MGKMKELSIDIEEAQEKIVQALLSLPAAHVDLVGVIGAAVAQYNKAMVDRPALIGLEACLIEVMRDKSVYCDLE